MKKGITGQGVIQVILIREGTKGCFVAALLNY
jgi:hypothetical protein